MLESQDLSELLVVLFEKLQGAESLKGCDLVSIRSTLTRNEMKGLPLDLRCSVQLLRIHRQLGHVPRWRRPDSTCGSLARRSSHGCGPGDDGSGQPERS